MENRTNRGTFKPGYSGIPGGRPALAREVKVLAMEHTTEAIGVLVGIMRDKNAATSSRAAAANAILDRAIGKPELSARIENTQRSQEIDLSVLSPEEYAAFER